QRLTPGALCDLVAAPSFPQSVGMRRLDQFEQRLANVPLFRACSKQDLRHIARLADYDSCRAGDVLVREGRRGNELYVIVNGEAEITRDGVTIATLKPGD